MFLFHNVIDLRYIEQGSRVGRTLGVVKMRNSRPETTLSSYTVTGQGITGGEKLEGVNGASRLGRTAKTAGGLGKRTSLAARSPTSRIE